VLDCVREALRLALKELTQSAVGLGRQLLAELQERYVESKDRLQSQFPDAGAQLQEAGVDAARLCIWVKSLSDINDWDCSSRLIQRVFDEHFELWDRSKRFPTHDVSFGWCKIPTTRIALCRQGQGNRKRSMSVYKVQVAETVVEGNSPRASRPVFGVGNPDARGARERTKPGPKDAAEQAAMGLEKPSHLCRWGLCLGVRR